MDFAEISAVADRYCSVVVGALVSDSAKDLGDRGWFELDVELGGLFEVDNRSVTQDALPGDETIEATRAFFGHFN